MYRMAALQKLNHYGGFALLAVSVAHLLNDAMQTAIPASFPLFQQNLGLTFTQIGWIAFALNVTASVLQPVIGWYTDKRPMPALMPVGMLLSLIGIVGFSLASSWIVLILSAGVIGLGSSVLHPESSRVAHLAAKNGKGWAQSVFQVGGNTGQALAPLAIAMLVVPQGQHGLLWFSIAAVIGIAVQTGVAGWYRRQLAAEGRSKPAQRQLVQAPALGRGRIAFAISILIVLLFSKFVYLSSMTGYYAFYYMDRYGLPMEKAQLCLFVLQAAGMLGTLLGGPLGDKFGRKPVIWFSIFGTAPFALALPYAGPVSSMALCFCIGFILMSGFSVIIVYAQELLPGKVGTISGLFFGLSFGLAGLGSVAIGGLIDWAGIPLVIRICALLPLLGAIAFLLPKDRAFRQMAS